MGIAVVALIVSSSPARADRSTSPSATTITIDHGAKWRRAARWTAVAGGALELASLTLCMYEKHRYDVAMGPLGSRIPSNPSPAQLPAINTLRSAHDIIATYGTGLAAAGIVALGTAFYFVVRDKQAGVTRIVPAISPEHAGVVVARAF
jgi:hypothetical protein